PLAVYTRRLAEGLKEVMPDWHVEWAMRYGAPALRKTLDGLRARGIRRIVVLPLYPQYSTTTTASIQDVIDAWRPSAPEIAVEVIQDYCEDA
ncbi:MAG: ferrochelatase, partial [Xanthomonas perforans]|nr:ferrochelatase [Xanthomonas perforans]